MDERSSMYHLHHRYEDLMREREHDRLVAIATGGQPGLLKRLLHRWFASPVQIVNNLVETETPQAFPDANLTKQKSVT